MADADCGGATSGRTCDLDRHRCVAGCGTTSGRNGCPTGQSCVVSGAGATARGVCTTDCTSSVVCGTMVPALPFCPDVGTMRRCVECRNDADCSGNTDGRKYCDRSASRCVSCLDGGASQCTAAGPGAACLSGGSCGCNTDTDCGARDSGRICDAYTHACRAGCRPMGAMGNACPTGMVCTAVFASLGRCGEAPDSGVDAGSDAADVPDATADRAVPNDLAVQDVPTAVDVTPDVPVVDVPDDLGMDAGLRTGNFQGGCGCRVERVGAEPRVVGVGALVLLGLLGRRRRRR